MMKAKTGTVDLKEKANFIRNEITRIAMQNRAGHIAPSLSCVDILVALYYEYMSYDAKNPLWEDRDRLIFSKAHGCYALYAILADTGLLPKREWENFYKHDSTLLGCMERRLEYGLEAGCGSLGHGLPIAVGLAFGAKIQKKKYNSYCITGDGELQEGSNWEALQFAVKHELKNLILVIDHNRLQAMDFIVNVLDRSNEDINKRLEGFGLLPVACNGHSITDLINSFKKAESISGDRPRVIIANTIKGFGLKCMEQVPRFHFCIPTEDELTMDKNDE